MGKPRNDIIPLSNCQKLYGAPSHVPLDSWHWLATPTRRHPNIWNILSLILLSAMFILLYIFPSKMETYSPDLSTESLEIMTSDTF